MNFKKLTKCTYLLSIFLLINIKQNVKAQIIDNPNELADSDNDEGGAERIKEFYKKLYFPFENSSVERNQEIWKVLDRDFPSENLSQGKSAVVTSWQCQGPYGASQPSLAIYKYSGRVTDMELTSTNNEDLKVMAASGNLWKYQAGTLNGECISNGLNSPNGGTILTDPTNTNVIFIGTGEPQVSSGTGLWKTIDGGASWQNIAMTPTSPNSFYHMLYDPTNANKIHAATSGGYYRSDDGGATWNRLKTGNCTDIAVDFLNGNNVYATFWGIGIYKSTDGGTTFTLLNTGGAPTTDFGRAALAMSYQNPDIIYLNLAKNSDNNTNGIYKTIDGGATWAIRILNPPGDFHSGQGWYNNCIAVSPINDSIVLAGGMKMMRTINGLSFTVVDTKHPDQHEVCWNANGTDVFVGNDGGVFRSADKGFSFGNISLSYGYNNLPITQYYHLSGGKSDPNTLGGTAQDNGVHIKSASNNYNWTVISGGDGSGIQIDPYDANAIMYGTGIFSAPSILRSRRFYSNNGGQSAVDVNNGITACNDWFPEIRYDGGTGYYYTACEKKSYYTSDNGQNWNLLNPTLFNSNVTDFSVSANVFGTPNVYMCLDGTSTKVMVYDRVTLTWINRSSGLASGAKCATVAPDINDPDIAYAVMAGIPGNGAGSKLYKTINRGQTWVNISGNIPNVSLTDLIANPSNSNELYVASEIGGFKSTDGGVTWNRWNFGMPESVIMTELDYIDSIAVNGKFYVLASTYGRSMWMREVSGNDPLTAFYETENGNANMMLFQNTDNPGDKETLINYYLSSSMNIELNVYDLLGNKIAAIIDGPQSQGSHTVSFDRSILKQGAYLYKLTSGRQAVTKKMIVIKK